MNEIWLIILASLSILVALAGIIVPVLPGAPLAWLGIFLYAYLTDFREVSVSAVAWLGVLAVITLLLDVLGPALGVRKQKASRQAVIGSVLGGLLGTAMLGPVGIILGPFIGAFLGELTAGRESRHALRSAFGALVGFLVGAMLKIIIVLIMAGYFIYALIF